MQAKVVVFWQPGFPTVTSQPIDKASLEKALAGLQPVFADEATLGSPDTLANCELLVLPYGSAVPVEAWKSMEHYLDDGGNLLVIGGQPLRVPVSFVKEKFVAASPQDTYSRALGFRHTYEAPVAPDAKFQWRSGYTWLPAVAVRAQTYFAIEGRLNGLGYMADSTGQLVAAPVIVSDHIGGTEHHMTGSRIVALDFNPQPDYWQSGDGIQLVQQSAEYARQGATEVSIETQYSAIRPGESPAIKVHVRNARQQRLGATMNGEVAIQLLHEGDVVQTATLPVTGAGTADLETPFNQPLTPGFYKISVVYSEAGHAREFYRNGFLVTEHNALASGPVLGVKGDFLSLDGKPFLPVGTNYFTTEENGWDFSGPRNAWVWDRDFAEMAAHGVSFVRTGVWMQNAEFVDPGTGGVNERFLRNLEAFLDCAQRHGIAINFTFFAFSPHSGQAQKTTDPATPPPNPYTDSGSVEAEQAYVHSVVDRFKDAPWLSWDLINEPSFSNPKQVFHGNYPNGDATEISAWHEWLDQKYKSLDSLGDAWRVPSADLHGFDSIPLPAVADLHTDRYGHPDQVRALDYNLFAQDMFSNWVKSMVEVIRSTGSKQLIDVGQDEGGVTDRVLNQFYGGAGVSFTTNHTYWQDDALLWDSVAAKRPGVPNITGETGYQPAWAPDGTWRYDEFTGLGLTERKWALGFAAGSSGAMQWDWAREPDFGMKRSDGSSKIWENEMRELGEFARKAAPFADSLVERDVAIVLPQSYQLSVSNAYAIEAQQTAVRALYNYAHSQAYAVGEYQIELLGSPKLILLPSPFGLTDEAWQAIEKRVEDGAVLLVTGPFGDDSHLHSTGRQESAGLPYQSGPLTVRDILFHFPGGDETLQYGGNKTTFLSRALLPNGGDWEEKLVGKGRILFSALPLELNGNLQAVADVYNYALKVAGVAPVYSTAINDPGILICPTRYPNATLYVITSESNGTDVSFEDLRSGKKIKGTLKSGGAALLLVRTDGKLAATYHWPSE
jgi:hypothetical protein